MMNGDPSREETKQKKSKSEEVTENGTRATTPERPQTGGTAKGPT